MTKQHLADYTIAVLGAGAVGGSVPGPWAGRWPPIVSWPATRSVCLT